VVGVIGGRGGSGATTLAAALAARAAFTGWRAALIDADKIPQGQKPLLAKEMGDSPALGKLVVVAGTNVSAAVGDGRLRLGDILVTDRVPAELPVLAGYLALEPATPNSHVAILASSLALPFAYANGAGLQAEIATLYGKEVLLVVDVEGSACTITLTDTTGLLTPARRNEILAGKQGGPLDIRPNAVAADLAGAAAASASG
jgi:hypothetical protein